MACSRGCGSYAQQLSGCAAGEPNSKHCASGMSALTRSLRCAALHGVHGGGGGGGGGVDAGHVSRYL